jgi:uncharacterized repeat protein (TIGR01451 family)
VLELRLDEYAAPFDQNYLTQNGVCTVSGTLNSNCDANERIQWDLAPLAAGERITVSFPLASLGSTSSPPNGTLLVARAEAFVPAVGATPRSRHARQQRRVEYARTLELALDASDDPVEPGTTLTYTATYANVAAAASAAATLSVPVPAGTNFVSATGGGVLSSGVVTWSLGVLSAGQSGTRQFTVGVNALAGGEVLRTAARLQAGSANARASSSAVVQAGSPLRLEIESDPDPVRNGSGVDVQVTVSNVGGSTIDPARAAPRRAGRADRPELPDARRHLHGLRQREHQLRRRGARALGPRGVGARRARDGIDAAARVRHTSSPPTVRS